jgi:ABC-type multidrug transport system fused ATPase/permease subunit
MSLKDFLAIFWRTRHYILPQLRHFIIFAILVGIATLLELSSFLIGYDLLLNKVFLGEPLSMEQVNLLGLSAEQYANVESLGVPQRQLLRNVFVTFMAALLAGAFVMGAAIPYYLTWILQRINQHLRLAMMDRAEQLSLKFHHDARVGDAIYRIFQDSAMVTNVIQFVFVRPAIELGTLFIAVVTVSLFSWYLGILFILAAVPSILAIAWFTPGIRSWSRHSRVANSVLTSHIQESLANLRLLKACGQEQLALSTFNAQSRMALDNAYELRKLFAITKLCVFFCTALIVIAADYLMAQWVWREEATFGYGLVALIGFAIWNLGAFQAAQSRMVEISHITGRLTGLWGISQDMVIGLERAFFLLDADLAVIEKEDAVPMPDVRKGVTFRQVKFAYETGSPVLQNVSFTAEPGKVTAIVGSTGAGKSTLMSLLLRLYDVDQGSVLVDAVDVRDLQLESLRRNIAVVLQENALFPTSVAENIRYAVPGASDEEIREAARISCADEFINELPEGFEMELGERGSKLSTGQRQRITIARSVIRNTPILILDEPTASMDVAMEQRVMRNLAKWGAGKVVFLITHRLATVRSADHIIFLEDCEIVEQGSHESLMAIEGGRYRNFVETESRITS